MTGALTLKPAEACRWDCVALGEVMLRFDPVVGRVRNTRQFQVWEGGGEYNVARALHKTFGLRTSVATALPRNDLGWLVEDLIGQGGVDASHITWRDFDGVGRNTRVGLNFVEKGFGLRPALGVSDRANSAASQIKPGEIDWDRLFGEEGVRWFHTGGIFAALSASSAETVIEAVEAARKHGVVVSYDLNYRASLWKSHGGKDGAQALNRTIAPYVDVMIGIDGIDEAFDATKPESAADAIKAKVAAFPNLKVAATTLRNTKTASLNDWSAILYADGQTYVSAVRENVEIYDRIGGGDGFASGMIYALLAGKDPQAAVDYGAAHGALAMTTPGDTSMARLEEVEALLAGESARVIR